VSKAAKRSVGLFLLAAALGVLAWRLWPDAGQARRQQRSRELLQAVIQNRLADATRLLDEGADPNTQAPPLSLAQKARWDYFEVSHGRKALTWGQMDAMTPGLSVLQIAVMNDNADMVRVLLSKGADAGYRNRAGQRALGMVVWPNGVTPPAAGKADRLWRIVALLKAAAAGKAPTPSPSPPQ
jgi:hypothetical protein